MPIFFSGGGENTLTGVLLKFKDGSMYSEVHANQKNYI